MSDGASPRPWRVKQSPIGSNAWIVSGEAFVASVSSAADAALIVAAVNRHGMPIVELIRGFDVLEAERDRLRDIVKRLLVVRENVFWRRDEKTGQLFESRMIDEEYARRAIEEARAAIGEG